MWSFYRKLIYVLLIYEVHGASNFSGAQKVTFAVMLNLKIILHL